MANYKCFFCGKQITSKVLKGRFSCPYCSSKVFFKPRVMVKKVKAI